MDNTRSIQRLLRVLRRASDPVKRAENLVRQIGPRSQPHPGYFFYRVGVLELVLLSTPRSMVELRRWHLYRRSQLSVGSLAVLLREKVDDTDRRVVAKEPSHHHARTLRLNNRRYRASKRVRAALDRASESRG